MAHISSEDCQGNLDKGLGNLLEVFSKATALELAQGKAWYGSALEDAERISALYNLPVETVVKVACALSPRLTWERNMPAAEEVIRHYVSGCNVPSIERYISGEMKLQRTKHNMQAAVLADEVDLSIQGPTKVNILKALWVLQGHEWVLRGKKVNSFCENILHWQTSQAVTVDSHAIQCWLGRMEAGTYAVTGNFYTVIEADYRKAAALVALTPLQFQAVVWIVKKRLSPKKGNAKTGVPVEWVVNCEAA